MSKVLIRVRDAIQVLRGKSPKGLYWDRVQQTVRASPEDERIAESVRPYTLTGLFRTHALIASVEYVVKRKLPGAFVECGVWRGGSVMAMLLKLQQMGVTDRDIYLYDTFEGMTTPTSADTSAFEPPALTTWQKAQSQGKRAWDQLFRQEIFTEQQVREALLKTGYPEKRLHFVRGQVEQTIPGIAPAQVALLRLDTDWYESTRHELLHLYPRLCGGGVLIVDDYGHWEGCRRAVDEYFSTIEAPVLLNRVDYAGRVAIKV